MFNRVAIIGVGLIGASLGLEIKKKKIARHITGYGRNRGNLQTAFRKGAIDRMAGNIEGAITKADLVLLCGPVTAIKSQLKMVAASLQKGALVMDVGSTKEEILKAAKALPKTVHFIAAHPMAGTEESGAGAAKRGLFQNKICILTPAQSTSSKALNLAKKFWIKMGSRVVIISPVRHDQTLALTSHLPQMAAYALMNVVGSLPLKKIKEFSGGGLRDTTRIAASPAEMWRDIVLSNAQNLSPLLKKYAAQILKIESAIKKGKGGELEKIFKQAADLRKKL